MIIEIPKVSEQGSQYEGEEDSSILGLEKDRLVRVDGPIIYDFFVQKVSQELLVQGRLSVKVFLCCSKCADFFSTTIQDLSFLRAYALSEELETIDLTEDIREDILLKIPTFFTCSSDCKGLCPLCGKNLNEETCDCRAKKPGTTWTALDKLDLS